MGDAMGGEDQGHTRALPQGAGYFQGGVMIKRNPVNKGQAKPRPFMLSGVAMYRTARTVL